ncbi:MAG: hypothetical protein ABIP50_03175 [Candidatus Saccharimonadales bacterium]
MASHSIPPNKNVLLSTTVQGVVTMTHGETFQPNTQRLSFDDTFEARRRQVMDENFIGPRHYSDFIHPEPIGPQDASDYARPLIEIRALDVAMAAVHNVTFYEAERRRLVADVTVAAHEGTINLTHGSVRGQLMPELIDNFVSTTLERSIPIVQFEDTGDLYAQSLRTIDNQKDQIIALQENTGGKERELKDAHLQTIHKLRRLFEARHPSAFRMAEFDVTAGIGTAQEAEQLEAATGSVEITASTFRGMIQAMLGQTVTGLLFDHRREVPISAPVHIIESENVKQ